MAHQFDGLVLVPNCDKIVPGMLMAAVRMNVPAVVVQRRPHAGRHATTGQEVSLSKMFEAVGAYKAGMISDEQLEDCTQNCLPRLRLLLRHVHRQLHELPVRGHRHRPAGQRHHPRGVQRAACSWPSRPAPPSWRWSAGTSAPGTSSTRGSIPQRPDLRHGPGLLHQHACCTCWPSPRRRAARAGPGPVQRDQREDPQPVPPGPCGPHPHAGPVRGRRHPRRPCRSWPSRACWTWTA